MKSGLKTSGFVNTRKTAPKMGDMLIAADIISEKDLQTALQIANQTATPIGRVLMDLKHVTAKNIDDVAALQVLVLDESLNGATAIKALGRAHRQNVSIEDALRSLGWTPPEPKEDNELGLLLVESEVINNKVYEDAVSSARENEITVAQYLILRNLLSPSVVNGALQAIVMIAQEKISKKDACQILKKICTGGPSFWEALSEVGVDSRSVRAGRLSLGEVLTQGGFISESERVAAVERALSQKQMLGELLVQSGIITLQVLESALQVQEIARSGVVSETEAVEVLRTSDRSKVSIKEAMESRISESERDKAAAGLDLLISAGILRQTDVARAVEKGKQFGVDPLRGMVIAGIVDRCVFDATRQLIIAIEANEQTQNQAIMLLNYVDRSRCSLEEAIENINNPPPAPPMQAELSRNSMEMLRPDTKTTGSRQAVQPKDFASLDQAVRKKMAPIFVTRFLRSLIVLVALFAGIKICFPHFTTTELGLLFSILVILDTIRLIFDLGRIRKDVYDLRSLDIEGVQQRPSASKQKKD